MVARFFLVTSRGQCASRWLADAMGSHPDVLCSHGPEEVWVAGSEGAAGIPAAMAPEGSRPRGVDAMFRRLRASREAAAYGNVQGYTLSGLTESLRERPATTSFGLVNLVRHPVTWLASASHSLVAAMRLSEVLLENRLRFYEVNRALCDALTRPFGEDPTSIETLAFLATCLGTLPGLAVETAFSGVMQVRMERVTTDPLYFRALMLGLAGEELHVDDGWLEEVFSAELPEGSLDDPRERHASWPAWKRAALAYVLSQGEHVAIFRRNGYDLGFAAERVDERLLFGRRFVPGGGAAGEKVPALPEDAAIPGADATTPSQE